MDGREAMAFSSGSVPYYIHRSGGTVGSGSLSGSLYTPHGPRTSSSPNFAAQPDGRPGSSGAVTSMVASNAIYGHVINISAPPGVSMSEPMKKKRGRPRKYAVDGQVSLGLSPLPVKSKPSSGEDSTIPKKNRGRPPGTGRKQRLATLGEWMNNSAGLAFAPHVITIGVGEDIVSKLLSISRQRPRAVCVLSGTGTVSSVTLREPASSVHSGTYEGCFEILCLSGSYLVAEDGVPSDRAGGISVSLASPDGHVIGGAVAMLIAATLVQVVVCSFVYGSAKNKDKPISRQKGEKDSETLSIDKSTTQKSAVEAPLAKGATPQSFITSPVSIWPGSRPVDLRHTLADIDLTRG